VGTPHAPKGINMDINKLGAVLHHPWEMFVEMQNLLSELYTRRKASSEEMDRIDNLLKENDIE
jgi:hypothetical protein